MVLAAVVVAVAADLLVERSDAMVEVYAESRRRFGGATLMRGGSMSTSLEPGSTC